MSAMAETTFVLIAAVCVIALVDLIIDPASVT